MNKMFSFWLEIWIDRNGVVSLYGPIYTQTHTHTHTHKKNATLQLLSTQVFYFGWWCVPGAPSSVVS